MNLCILSLETFEAIVFIVETKNVGGEFLLVKWRLQLLCHYLGSYR